MSRTCIGCRHWEFDPGTPDYSELTPGDAWSTGCLKQHWHLSGYRVTEAQYRASLNKADDCPDFEAVS